MLHLDGKILNRMKTEWIHSLHILGCPSKNHLSQSKHILITQSFGRCDRHVGFFFFEGQFIINN